MKRLEDVIELKKLGMPVITKLIKRTRKKAIYLRDDGYFEIFKIKTAKAARIFGKEYPERELYPGNEDFGATAWCTALKTEALEIYRKLK